MHFKHSLHSSECRLLIQVSFQILIQLVQIMKSLCAYKNGNSSKWLTIINWKICIPYIKTVSTFRRLRIPNFEGEKQVLPYDYAQNRSTVQHQLTNTDNLNCKIMHFVDWATTMIIIISHHYPVCYHLGMTHTVSNSYELHHSSTDSNIDLHTNKIKNNKSSTGMSFIQQQYSSFHIKDNTKRSHRHTTYSNSLYKTCKFTIRNKNNVLINLMFWWPCIIVYQYNETNVMRFSFNLLRTKGLYVFWTLPAHPQEVL
jgi:hypothetical protein